MSVEQIQRTATIHPFPLRADARDRLRRLRSEPVAAPVIYEGGWYHQDAIAEEAQATRGSVDPVGH